MEGEGVVVWGSYRNLKIITTYIAASIGQQGGELMAENVTVTMSTG